MTPTATLDSTVLQIQVPEFLQQTISQLIAFVPRLIGALVILVLGWIVGRVVAAVIRRAGDAADIDRRARNTPISQITDGGLSSVLGKIAAYYIYAVAILAAANALAIPLLSQWISRAISYLPALIAGLLVILFGFLVADFVADVIQRSSATTGVEYAGAFATGVRFFLYFIVITIGLDTMGIQVELLYVFARAIAYGLGAALAIGLGLALGLGGRGYVADNIDDWAGRASRQGITSGSGADSSGQLGEDD